MDDLTKLIMPAFSSGKDIDDAMKILAEIPSLPVTEYRIIKRCGMYAVQSLLSGRWADVLNSVHATQERAGEQRAWLMASDPSQPFEVVDE